MIIFSNRKIVVLSLIILLLLINSAVSVSEVYGSSTSRDNFQTVTSPEHLVPVKVQFSEQSPGLSVFSGNLNILITLNMNNQSALSRFLKDLSTYGNPLYHKYLTRDQFASLYSPSQKSYNEVVDYFLSLGISNIQTYSDRLYISFSLTSTEASKIFNVPIYWYNEGGHGFYAPLGTPTLPLRISSLISNVEGLDDYYQSHPLGGQRTFTQLSSQVIPSAPPYSSLFPQPLYDSYGNQYLWGSDLQVAYNELGLFNFTYPTNEVVATILWTGTYVNSSGSPILTPYGYIYNGTAVGGFNPSDISYYFNQTIPGWEPKSKVYGVPIDGTPKPGPLASYDTTGAVGENTLDLEMVGSTAPGASIYNVYGWNGSSEQTDAAIAYVLNPNSSFSSLNRVSVITMSYGGPEYNDTTLYTLEKEAQARGITMLASSGDSGDNPSSSKYAPNYNSNDWVYIPAAESFNYFGVTAVGGTTTVLTPTNPSNLLIYYQIPWYISGTNYGGPAGSTGGVSYVFPELYWQKETVVNSLITSMGLPSGRAVPDISAIANNTLIYESSGFPNGTISAPNLLGAWGTSIASPVTAGLIAESDAVLNSFGGSNVGYLNPYIYVLGQEQLNGPYFYPNGTNPLYYEVGWNSSLPANPFYTTYSWGNYQYYGTYGYNLVSGWGSLNIYNFTNYMLNLNFNGQLYAVGGVDNYLNLSGLNVASYYQNGTVNSYYNASIQQNFIIANELGAPLYWIQNVIYITYYKQNTFAMWYSGWVVYPFYGQSAEFVYSNSWPNGSYVTIPQSFHIRTWLTLNPSSFNRQVINFQVNSQVLHMPVPGAAYIIGTENYKYYLNGMEYENGPYPGMANASWGLDPQLGLVGGPSLSTGYFGGSTGGTLTTSLEPLGSSTYVPASSSVFYYWGDQTGETAANLLWAKSGSQWKLSLQSGSTQQGIASYMTSQQVTKQYQVTFTESGLPSGTTWSVTAGGSTQSSSTNSISFTEPNGTYSFSVGAVSGYTSSPSSGSLTVNGNSVTETIIFTKSSQATYSVIFYETGLSSGTSWSVTLQGSTGSSSTNTISFTEPNGTYSFSVGAVSGYTSTNSSGSVTVNGQSANVEIVFTPTPTYSKVNVTGTIDPYNATLYINGQIVSTAGGAFNVSLAPGTYQIQVKSQGYQTFTETISVPSNRSYFSLGLITLQKNSSPPPAIPSWIYLVIALLIVGVIAGAAASVRGKRSRGKPRPPPPPPSH